MTPPTCPLSGHCECELDLPSRSVGGARLRAHLPPHIAAAANGVGPRACPYEINSTGVMRADGGPPFPPGLGVRRFHCRLRHAKLRWVEGEHKYPPFVGSSLGWTGGLGVPLHTETVLSGGDRQERRGEGNDVPNDLVDALFHRAAGIAMGTRRSALAVIHHGNRVRS